MSSPISRDDLGALAVFGALAWYLDNPWALAVGGLYVSFLSPIAEAVGRAAGRAVSRRLRRNRAEKVRLS